MCPDHNSVYVIRCAHYEGGWLIEECARGDRGCTSGTHMFKYRSPGIGWVEIHFVLAGFWEQTWDTLNTALVNQARSHTLCQCCDDPSLPFIERAHGSPNLPYADIFAW